MPTILIVYHSQSGNTRAMAETVAKGVEEEGGVDVALKKASEATVDDLLEPDGIILGSPVYYGTMAACLKQLLDDSVCYHGQLAGKVGAAFASSANVGGGNETTVLDLLKALLIHGMIVQGDHQGDHYGPVSIGSPDGRAREECRRLGLRTARLVKRLCAA